VRFTVEVANLDQPSLQGMVNIPDLGERPACRSTPVGVDLWNGHQIPASPTSYVSWHVTSIHSVCSGTAKLTQFAFMSTRARTRYEIEDVAIGTNTVCSIT
jgi:hypothetical protein